jgi:hypothetical protein
MVVAIKTLTKIIIWLCEEALAFCLCTIRRVTVCNLFSTTEMLRALMSGMSQFQLLRHYDTSMAIETYMRI